MAATSMHSLFLAAAHVMVGGLLLTACPQGDVGAPCNHGTSQPPVGMLVTFPALSCSNLLCVYGEEQKIPANACKADTDCNNNGETTFVCNTKDSECALNMNYVLERSMCSIDCESDADCKNDGPTHKPLVDDEDTSCADGFKCKVLMELGEFCCRAMCICSDDLPATALDEVAETCKRGEAEFCEYDDK